MKNLLIVLTLSFSSLSYAQLAPVVTGTPIQATKINEIISEVNDTKSTMLAKVFDSETATLVYATSASYNKTTLKDAPIGTFITLHGPANTQPITQTSTSPSQSIASMNTNGFLITAKPYDSNGNVLTPSHFAIQIGKNLKIVDAVFYEGAGKTGDVLDVNFFVSSNGLQAAGIVRSYNPTTGIYTMNGGFSFNNHNSRYIGSGPSLSSNPTTAYAIIKGYK